LSKLALDYGHDRIRAAGLTDTEYMICILLYNGENSSQDEISEALALNKTTVAKALTALEGRGLVGRCQNPMNKRKNNVRLLPEGYKSLSLIKGICEEWLQKITDCLTLEEINILSDISERALIEAKELRKKTKVR